MENIPREKIKEDYNFALCENLFEKEKILKFRNKESCFNLEGKKRLSGKRVYIFHAMRDIHLVVQNNKNTNEMNKLRIK